MPETPPKSNKKAPAPEFTTGEQVLSAPWGTVRVEVTPDAMEVAFLEIVGVPSLCSHLKIGEIGRLLRKHHITHGVVKQALLEIVTHLATDHEWEGDLAVAEGCPPEVPFGVDYTMFKPAKVVKVIGPTSMNVDGSDLIFTEIKSYFAQHHEAEDPPDLLAKMVSGGEVLVARKPPFNGKPGYDVFGRKLEPPEFNEVLAGENVDLIADGTKFSARFFGYPILLHRELSVLSPIVVSDDVMVAWFVQLPQLKPWKSPYPIDITNLLTHAGLKRELKGENVDELCQKLQREKKTGWHVAAKGMDPEKGLDGALVFEGTDPPSALRDDGTMDYRVMNLVKTTEPNNHFATLTRPTDGIPGFTLLDEELPPEPGEPKKVDAKGNVRVEEGADGEILYFSETEGVIQYKNGQLSIDPLYKVTGNIDFSTGNVDVDCCMSVGGNVCSDFIVKSTRDVVVNGTLEPGSKLVVEGDLQVKGGIIGENTEVMVLGNLQAEYVQDAKIVVKGQILINQYAFSARIRCVGGIQVGPGTGERGGVITGGNICSSSKIEAKSVGSPSNVLTSIAVEPAPHKLAKLDQINKQITECETSITRIMRTLDLAAIKPDLVKQLLQDAKPKQRKLYVKILKQLNLLVKRQHELVADKRTLKEILWKDMAKMSIQINKKFYSNTQVRIGQESYHNRDDMGMTTITHGRKELKLESAKAGGSGGNF